MGKKGAIINFEEGVFGNAGTPLTKDNIIVFGDDESQGAPVSHTHEIADVNGLQGELDGKVDNSQVLTDVPAGAVFTDTVYSHPTQTVIETNTLTGAVVVSRIAVDDKGHTTVVATRTLTPADIAAVALEGDNTLTGNLTLNGGDLSFLGNSDFLVSGNRYAFRYSADQNYGMYFNSTSGRVETKGAGGAVRWYSDVGNGNMWAGGIITASGGNSTNWNTAFGWGNHAGLYAPISHVHAGEDITTGTIARERVGVKPVKYVYDTDLTAGKYIAIEEDKNYWLQFLTGADAIIQIDDSFGAGFELEGSAAINNTLTVEGIGGCNVYYPDGFTSVIEKKGVFGWKQTGNNYGMLFGALIPA
jgi:hypothetical protein